MIFLTVNTFFETAALVAAVIFLTSDDRLIWRLWIPYLLVTVIAEIYGIRLRLDNKPNVVVYNLLLIAECLMLTSFFFYLFKRYYKRQLWVYLWIPLFVVGYTWESVHSFSRLFLSYTASLMSVVFVVAGCFYFLQLMRDEDEYLLKRYPQFWWVAGVLLFYFGSIVANLFNSYLVANEFTVFRQSVRYLIYSILNIYLILQSLSHPATGA